MADNPSAFPFKHEWPNDHVEFSTGMTLRDWFAGQAIGAIVAAVSAGQHSTHPDRQLPDSFATDAYAIADAMLEAREADPRG